MRISDWSSDVCSSDLTAVKGASHFLRLDIALRLQESHQARLFPAIRIDQGMQSFGQDTGYVFKQAAAGDMRQRTDSPAMNKRQQRLHIDSGGSHQGIDQQNILIEQSRPLKLPALVRGKEADQRTNRRATC